MGGDCGSNPDTNTAPNFLGPVGGGGGEPRGAPLFTKKGF